MTITWLIQRMGNWYVNDIHDIDILLYRHGHRTTCVHGQCYQTLQSIFSQSHIYQSTKSIEAPMMCAFIVVHKYYIKGTASYW